MTEIWNFVIPYSHIKIRRRKMSNISILTTDISTIIADAIVNAANTHLKKGGGVCGSIFNAAGEDKLTAACNSIGHCDVGCVAVTDAFALNARIIIHAVGPKWNGGENFEESVLYECYYNALKEALKYRCNSIAFPLISSGKFGMPYEKVWDQALEACVDFLDDNMLYDFDIFFAVKNQYAGYGHSRISESQNIQRVLEKYKKAPKSREKREFAYGCVQIFDKYLELIFYSTSFIVRTTEGPIFLISGFPSGIHMKVYLMSLVYSTTRLFRSLIIRFNFESVFSLNKTFFSPFIIDNSPFV